MGEVKESGLGKCDLGRMEQNLVSYINLDASFIGVQQCMMLYLLVL